MNYWGILVGAVFIGFVAGIVFMVRCMCKFSFIRKLSGDRKWFRIVLGIGLMLIPVVLVTFILSFVNAVVFFLHGVVFFLIWELIFLIVRKVSHKEFKLYWAGICAVLTTVIYVAIGIFMCAHVWQKNYTLTTSKGIRPVRIALIADSHLGTTFGGEGFAEYMREIEAQEPDMLIISGDFVDDATGRDDMVRACEALGDMDLTYGVFFAYGNHDKGYYDSREFSADDLLNELVSNGVFVLEDQAVYIGDDLCVLGRADASTVPERADIGYLTGQLDNDRYIIVIDHEPNDFETEAAAGCDLVLSGHTHGGQMFPFTLMGRIFGNDRDYGYERRDNTDFIVTSGIADWELWFKTGVRSEYVIIDLS